MSKVVIVQNDIVTSLKLAVFKTKDASTIVILNKIIHKNDNECMYRSYKTENFKEFCVIR